MSAVVALGRHPLNILFLVLFWLLSSRAGAMGTAPVVEYLRLGAYEGDVGALVWIAQDKGLFNKVGLNVDLKGFASGKTAMEALDAGQVDVATASEFVFATVSLRDQGLRILGNISHYRNKAVVARRDSGIKLPADLKGKRVGLTVPSGAEYSLHVFLALQGLTTRNITSVSLDPKALADAIANGKIDAAITWQPHVQTIEKRLGQNAITFPGDSYDQFLLLVSRSEVISARESAIRKLFAGLLLAEEWVLAHPEEARRYIATRFKLDLSYVSALWPHMRLSVDFPQELMTALDGEAVWLVRRGGAAAGGSVPNYANFIVPGPLRAVRPAAVTVFSR